jgi:hypothetical protein
MAALLVAMAVMAVVMSVLLPVWHTLSVREKEEELMFRGQQYDRAIQLFRKKNAAPGPPNVDALIQGRFLRKKFKDPITGADFNFVGVNAGQPNAPGRPAAAARLRPVDRKRAEHEQGALVPRARWRHDLRPVAVHLRSVETGRAGGAANTSAVRECRRVPAVGADPEHVRALRALAPGRVAGAVRARAARPVAPEAASSSPLIPGSATDRTLIDQSSSAAITASCTCGRRRARPSCESVGRDGWTRLVSSTTYKSRSGSIHTTCR